MEQENKSRKPLIHCITNPIAMNQSANAILALGARPIMAEHPLEVEEITATADALLLNFGNISDTRMEAMGKSLVVANNENIPVVVDAVGVACSKLRLEFFRELASRGRFTVIKGNYSEILALYDDTKKSSGVDVIEEVEPLLMEQAVANLIERYEAIIVATGEKDLIATNEEIVEVTGGCIQLGEVTGTGCMLGAIIATALAFDNTAQSVEKACRFFKACGVKAKTAKGSGTFMVNLLDAIGEKDGV